MLEKLHWLIVSAEKFLKQSTRECNLCTDGCFLIRAVQTFYWCVRRWHYNERTSFLLALISNSVYENYLAIEYKVSLWLFIWCVIVVHWVLMFSSQISLNVQTTPNQFIFSGLFHCGTYFYLKPHFSPWSLNPACEHKCALKYFRLNLKMRSKFFEIPGRAVEVPVRHCARCRTGQVSAAARDTDWHRLSSPPAPRPNWNLYSTFHASVFPGNI